MEPQKKDGGKSTRSIRTKASDCASPYYCVNEFICIHAHVGKLYFSRLLATDLSGCAPICVEFLVKINLKMLAVVYNQM